ncbi:MAG: hypothetical protein NC489_33535 [Ruminococcus flavefaciens]|nr:hypothetical protein [Ruminococcus flavefaciens]
MYAPGGVSRPPAGGSQGTPREKRPPYGILVAVACIAATICAIFALLASSTGNGVQREKLGAEACISMDAWIDDRLGWLADTGQVQDAMQYFYSKTGVQPYLLICDELDGKGGEITDQEAEDALEDLYDSLFRDEGHMIYGFMEYADSEYVTWIYTGWAADSVMDSSARGIFLGNADRYYTDSSLTDDGYFAKTFRKSADAIMDGGKSAKRVFTACMATSGILAAGCVIGIVWLAVKDAKRREREQLQEILDTPVGGSPDLQDLADRYGQE